MQDNQPNYSPGPDNDPTNQNNSAEVQYPPQAANQEVIRPSSEYVGVAQDRQSSVPEPVFAQHPSAVTLESQAPDPQSIYPQAGGVVTGQIQTSASGFPVPATKRRNRWLKAVSILAVFLVLGTFGVLMATNQNIRATLLGQKLVTYKYPLCKTAECTIKFYKGSKIASYTPWSPPGQTPLKSTTSLISPIIDGKTYIAMRIEAMDISAASETSSKQLIASFNDCSATGMTNGFRDYLPNLDANINVCAIPSDNHEAVLGYATAFASQKTHSFLIVIINEDFSLNSQGQTSPVFNLANHESEMQQILASLDVKG